MAWADAIAFPFLVDQPIARWIGEVRADDAERFAGDEARFTKQAVALRGGERSGWCQRGDLRAPENFVGHPVADAGETALQKQDGFDRRPGVAAQKCVEEFSIEVAGRDVRRSGAPPGRRGFSVMKPNPAEEPGIPENEGMFHLVENEMIVVFRAKSRRLNPQLSGHAEMDSDPVATGKFEEHLFSPGRRTEKSAAGQFPHERSRVRAAKDSLRGVELHAHNFLAEPRVPLPAKKFHFGELRHRAN